MGCNDTDNYSDYSEISVFEQTTLEEKDGTVTVTVSLTKEQVAKYKDLAMVGIDVYTTETVKGVTSSPAFTTTVNTWAE
jgi:hypothetical protein